MSRLGDSCEILSGYAFDSKLFTMRNNECIPIIRIRDVVRGYSETGYLGDYELKYIIKQGDYLVGMDGEFNIGIWDDEDALLNQRVCKLIPDEKEVLPQYLFYFLPKKLKEIELKTSFVTVKHLSVKTLNEIEISLPPIEEQKKIAEILDKASNLISLRKKQIEKLDLLVKSRFVEMFGDLHSNSMKWENGIISDYCQVKGGKRVPKGEKFSDVTTAHPYLRVLDLKNATVLEDDIKYISDEIYKKIKRYTISYDDVYLTNVGEKLGMAGTIPHKFNNANLTENAVKLILNRNVINKVYLAYYLNSTVGQKYILERKMIVGVPKLAIFRIENLPVIVPPIELQNQFCDFVQFTDKKKSEMQAGLEKLELNYKALMQQYFS